MAATVIWTHQYTPVGDSLLASAAVAALPILTLVVLLAGLRRPSWQAALGGLATAALIAVGVYGMPVGLMLSATAYGAAFGKLSTILRPEQKAKLIEIRARMAMQGGGQGGGGPQR